jgi:hypothetical protein
LLLVAGEPPVSHRQEKRTRRVPPTLVVEKSEMEEFRLLNELALSDTSVTPVTLPDPPS